MSVNIICDSIISSDQFKNNGGDPPPPTTSGFTGGWTSTNDHSGTMEAHITTNDPAGFGSGGGTFHFGGSAGSNATIRVQLFDDYAYDSGVLSDSYDITRTDLVPGGLDRPLNMRIVLTVAWTPGAFANATFQFLSGGFPDVPPPPTVSIVGSGGVKISGGIGTGGGTVAISMLAAGGAPELHGTQWGLHRVDFHVRDEETA